MLSPADLRRIRDIVFLDNTVIPYASEDVRWLVKKLWYLDEEITALDQLATDLQLKIDQLEGKA